MFSLRGIRGAIRVEKNTKEVILSATRNLLAAMVRDNNIRAADIASMFFTVTSDLNAEFPAHAVQDIEWKMVPRLCAREINVPGSMTRVIRILLHVNTTLSQKQIKHQYLGETAALRPDLQGVDDDDRSNES